jgi:hypothetical protein
MAPNYWPIPCAAAMITWKKPGSAAAMITWKKPGSAA